MLEQVRKVGLTNLNLLLTICISFLAISRDLLPGDEDFWSAEAVCIRANAHLSRAKWLVQADSVDHAITLAVQDVINAPRKLVGNTCYFLSCCAGCCYSRNIELWRQPRVLQMEILTQASRVLHADAGKVAACQR